MSVTRAYPTTTHPLYTRTCESDFDLWGGGLRGGVGTDDESPLHTALCALEEADGYLASVITRIPIELSFIYTTATLRKVCYCLLDTFMSVCHPAIDLCRRHQLVSHIIRGCGLTFVQNVRGSSTVVLLTDL